MTAFTINGRTVDVTAEPDTPLLWVIREQLKLTGTKFGCGIAQCGACMLHVDSEPVRACGRGNLARLGRGRELRLLCCPGSRGSG